MPELGAYTANSLALFPGAPFYYLEPHSASKTGGISFPAAWREREKEKKSASL
jgi:hypothetical protein